jgi:hypothetical protein
MKRVNGIKSGNKIQIFIHPIKADKKCFEFRG